MGAVASEEAERREAATSDYEKEKKSIEEERSSYINSQKAQGETTEAFKAQWENYEKAKSGKTLTERLATCDTGDMCKKLVLYHNQLEILQLKASVQYLTPSREAFDKIPVNWQEAKSTLTLNEVVGAVEKEGIRLKPWFRDTLKTALDKAAKMRRPVPDETGRLTQLGSAIMLALTKFGPWILAGFIAWDVLEQEGAKNSICYIASKDPIGPTMAIRCADQANEIQFAQQLAQDCTCIIETVASALTTGPCSSDGKACQALTQQNCTLNGVAFDATAHLCPKYIYNFIPCNLGCALNLIGGNVGDGANTFAQFLLWVTTHLSLIVLVACVLVLGGFFLSVFRTVQFSK